MAMDLLLYMQGVTRVASIVVYLPHYMRVYVLPGALSGGQDACLVTLHVGAIIFTMTHWRRGVTHLVKRGDDSPESPPNCHIVVFSVLQLTQSTVGYGRPVI